MFPPFWKQDSHWVTVEFSKAFTLEEAEDIAIGCEGRYNLMLDGKLQFLAGRNTFTIPAGEHKLNLKVWNQTSPPALFIDGKTVKTDSTWLATYEDKIWIDENGVAHGSGIYVPAASWNFDKMETPPSNYQLERKVQRPVGCDEIATNGTEGVTGCDKFATNGSAREARSTVATNGTGRLYDFGKETFGYLRVKGLKGRIRIYYGESREEALDKEHCETLDVMAGCDKVATNGTKRNGTVREAPNGTAGEVTNDDGQLGSKAFRYVYIETEEGSRYDEVYMEYEYAPFDVDKSGSFCCSDGLLNQIWEVGAYTMDLTTREFFMDGIKRDRWTWSGDAIQSYLMNYYLRFDTECVKRTIRQLRGKDPVTAHVNTIMDYTFYWFKSVLDYYLYTGDIDFVREIYPKMQTLMDYVLGRTNDDGMAEGQADDWIFVDWVDFPMHKRGVLCFEQILFCKALETMQRCAEELRSHPLEQAPQGSITDEAYAADAERYRELAEQLWIKVKNLFWDKEKKTFMHAVEDGKMNEQVTKFPNMFAMIYGFASEEEQRQIMERVMLNPQVDAITTPYMRFYELEALCRMGRQQEVLKEIRDYWGGMLAEGATTFWEKYNPGEKGTEHLAMYGRPYGKSLCHAWGASPVYLLGRYYLGVSPLAPGYAEYEVRPVLGDLQWMEGAVPTPFGLIHVKMTTDTITVEADGGKGILIAPDGQRIDIQGKTTYHY